MTNTSDSIRPAIIVPAFSRPQALRRLLASINRAHYPDDSICLVISLEGGAKKEVVECARSFKFNAGIVEVVERRTQLGLREHILWCGDQTQKYGSVIVLEDDLLVDPWFYEYSIAALAAFDGEHDVAGIALYAPQYNEFVGLPFEAIQNGTSSYLMQVACSWGQIWTSRQWEKFRAWYADADEGVVDNCELVPSDIRKWPASSWKKYFAAYLAISEQYFVYPYSSYTTNCADPGGKHMVRGTEQHQVPLPDPQREFVAPCFHSVDKSMVTYDPFMEPRVRIDFEELSVAPGSLAVDFYCAKPLELLRKFDYCLTMRPVRAAIEKYPLSFRPLPLNIYVRESGAGDGPISLCRSDMLYDREPLLQHLRSRYQLKLYFAVGRFGGGSILMLMIVRLFKHVYDRLPLRRPD